MNLTNEVRPVILTDVDGVLISWQSGLPYFAQKYNLPLDHILKMMEDDKFIPPAELFGCDEKLAGQLIEKYNSSDFIRYLAPYMDALKIVNKMKSKCDFVAITALGDSIDARLNRQFNLNALFPGAFKEIYMCGHNQSKEELFKQVKEKYGERITLYVDDLPGHCDHAKQIIGCHTFFMPRGERSSAPTEDVQTVKDWNELATSLVDAEFEKIKQAMTKATIKQLLEDKFPKDALPFPWKTNANDFTIPRPQWGGIEYYLNQPTAILTAIKGNI